MKSGDIVAFVGARAAQYRPVLLTMEPVVLAVRANENVWSPLQYLAHMRDIAVFYHDRLHRVLTESRPTMQAGIDGVRFAQLAEEGDYQRQSATEVMAAFEQAVELLCEEISDLSESQWSRVGIGSDGDERSLLHLARRFAHELHHHFGDIVGIECEHMKPQITERLREVGWELWDPIGLSAMKGGWKGQPFEDEYDRYMPKAATMLRRGCDAEEVIDYFFYIQSVFMVIPPKQINEHIHEKLLKLVTAISDDHFT